MHRCHRIQVGWDQTGDPTTYAWETTVHRKRRPRVPRPMQRPGPTGWQLRYHATASFPHSGMLHRHARRLRWERRRPGGPGAGDGAHGGPGSWWRPPSCEDDADCTMDSAPTGPWGAPEPADGDGRCVPTCTTDAIAPKTVSANGATPTTVVTRGGPLDCPAGRCVDRCSAR